jgi:hypothetical protein
MATVSTNTFLDSLTRVAGEAMTITAGATLTVRTDYRVSSGAPASNLGSLAAVTVTEGELLWDSRNVRWLAYNTGSGNVPAIGTTISQGGVSGYLLGVWASKTVAQTAVAAAMPATGFIKFRETAGGVFSAGALTGIGASAIGPDVQGWVSLPHDAAIDITVPRLGKHTARGGKFFLESTSGSIAQVFQVPTDGSAAMYAPGLWVETGVSTDVYEYWPGLFSATNGWSHLHVGEAAGATDKRQNFVKILAGGQLQMGESVTQASTYASLAAQASTYAEVSHACTYIWESDLVTVYYATGHLLETDMQTGLDFTSGAATADAIYTVTVLSPFHFTVPLAGSGLGGNVTSKPGVTVTFTAHTLNIGEQTYCDFTSGTGVDGTYTVYAVPSANTYLIAYPHVAALTAGNVSCIHTLVVTFTAHGMAIGNKVYLDFTTGTGVDGQYTIKALAANTYNVNFPHNPITSGNVTMMRTIGNIAPTGCRTWIPSNILNEVATGARATNTVPNTTIASRPEWVTTSAGYIDLEYVYGCSGYPSFNQAFNVRIQNCAFFDTLVITECASPLDLNHCHVSMQGALDINSLVLTSNFAGGIVANGKFHRGNAPGTTDHAAFIQYCKGITFNYVDAAIVQYARSTGLPFQITYCSNLTFNNCRCLNGNVTITASTFLNFTNFDYCDRVTGRTNVTTPLYAFLLGAGSTDIKVDGVTFGYGTIQDCHPSSGIISYTACARVKVRNVGTRSVKLSGGTWAINAYGMAYLGVTGGNNDDIKLQRIYLDKTRTAPYTNINSDKNMLYESVYGGAYNWSTKALISIVHADLNGYIKGCQEVNSVSGSASVYGTHFEDLFLDAGRGRVVLPFNEPTTETSAVFQMNSGAAKFNSSGGILLATVGNQCTFTDLFYRKGHTGFERTEALLSGPTQTRFDIHYAIDTGSGFGSFHNLYYQRAGGSGSSAAYTFTVTDATGVEVGDYVWGTGVGQFARITNIVSNTITVNVANTAAVSGVIRFNHLPFESISPSTGFKLKFRLTVIVTETVACAFLRVDTISTVAAQTDNLYPIDTCPVLITNLAAGSRVVAKKVSDSSVLANVAEVSGTASFETEYVGDVSIEARKASAAPYYTPWNTQITTVAGITASAVALQTRDDL